MMVVSVLAKVDLQSEAKDNLIRGSTRCAIDTGDISSIYGKFIQRNQPEMQCG